MSFKTKLDYSNNRQIKQHFETLTLLSGATSFGVPFNDLPTGPNLNTSGETENYSLVASTFSGNNTTTNFSWYDSRMELGHPYISAITPSNSAETQTVLPVYAPSGFITIDGNTSATGYTGVTFDLTVITMTDLGGGNYMGTVEHDTFDVLSASTLDFTGRTIWADVSGITRTNRLIITDTPQIGYVLTCVDSEGMSQWSPANTGTTTLTYWSAGTGLNAIVTKGSSNIASGDFALASGEATQATGLNSYAEGYQTQATGARSHAEGFVTKATGSTSHAEGELTLAGGGFGAHAEGWTTKAMGVASHAEGRSTQANGSYSHSEGQNTQALGNFGSHAEGDGAIASGNTSHAQGFQTQANGFVSHAGGFQTIANGQASFVHGQSSQANGNFTIVLGRNIIGNQADTTYLDMLNLSNLSTGTSINNLGIDSNGYIVVGTSGGGGTSYWSAGTGTNSICVVNSNGIASGDNSVSEGQGSIASGTIAIASGYNTLASGFASLAQNSGTSATGDASYAEGAFTIASGSASHAEGAYTIAGGFYASHAEGLATRAWGEGAHAEGRNTIASGTSSHAQNDQTQANGVYTHAGGIFSIANGTGSFVHGSGSTANGDYSIVLGNGIIGNTADTTYVDRFNIKTLGGGASINNLGIDASGNVVIGVIGSGGTTNVWSAGTGTASVSTIGGGNIASGNYSLASGNLTTASGTDSHSEGVFSTASGVASHAEGRDTKSIGSYSHSEGWLTIASGISSHSEGTLTQANSDYSHAGGYRTNANGAVSFVHGTGSTANGDYSIVLGRNITGNTADTTYIDQLNIKTVGSSPSVNDIRIDAVGNLTTNTSDKRFKENIVSIDGALDKINALQGVKFQWKDRIAGGNDFKLGFIAQEVEEVEPLLVFTNKNDGYKGIHIDGIIPLLVEAVKELSNGVTTYNNTHLETQTILAEDNNIELNYNGSPTSSIGGGIKILNTDNDGSYAELVIDENGNWITNNGLKPKELTIPFFTPTSSNDETGSIGNITRNDDYLFVKTNKGWKRSNLESF